MPWNSAKAKVQLRISVQRLRTLQQKKAAQAKVNRRDIATLLERSRIETARIKVESIINEDIHVELLELMELYSELLISRFGLLDVPNQKEPDPAVSEAVNAVIHAGPRTELKELHVLRDILMHKYGREYSLAVMENKDNCVSDRVVRKLVVATPSSELVDAYLNEIAKAYKVDWSPSVPVATEDVEKEEGDDDEGGVKDSETKKVSTPSPTPKLPDIPPTESQEDLSGKNKDKSGAKVEVGKQGKEKKQDDFDELSKRFAALKKR